MPKMTVEIEVNVASEMNEMSVLVGDLLLLLLLYRSPLLLVALVAMNGGIKNLSTITPPHLMINPMEDSLVMRRINSSIHSNNKPNIINITTSEVTRTPLHCLKITLMFPKICEIHPEMELLGLPIRIHNNNIDIPPVPIRLKWEAPVRIPCQRELMTMR